VPFHEKRTVTPTESPNARAEFAATKGAAAFSSERAPGAVTAMPTTNATRLTATARLAVWSRRRWLRLLQMVAWTLAHLSRSPQLHAEALKL
jgi:hypothetical protein